MDIKENNDIRINVVVDGITSMVLGREKVFKTGSRGYYVFGKVFFNGKKHQLIGNLVEVHSKPQK